MLGQLGIAPEEGTWADVVTGVRSGEPFVDGLAETAVSTQQLPGIIGGGA